MTDRPPLLKPLFGEALSSPPVWFMRQAGRYLPEYRDLRAQAGSFLDLCFDPELAAEVTLQPVRRYRLDAAILFADILLIPHALGQALHFEEGEGPRLSPPLTPEGLARLRPELVSEMLGPVFETVRQTKAALDKNVALLGFAGAPWTVATYMLAGRASKDPAELRAIAYRDPQFIADLMSLLVSVTADYLIAQIDAGADAVQVFESWAGGLPEEMSWTLSVAPMQKLISRVKAARPQTPIIVFPRGAGVMLENYAALADCDAVSIDTMTPWAWARRHVSPHCAVQGGLDPLLVIAGGAAMENAARHLIETFRGVPYIFNLGHGFLPATPPEHVARLVKIVREAI